jgi:hypothetical protein
MALEWAAGIAAWLGGFELVKLFISDITVRSIAAEIYVVVTAVGLALALFIREWFTSRKEKYALRNPGEPMAKNSKRKEDLN